MTAGLCGTVTSNNIFECDFIIFREQDVSKEKKNSMGPTDWYCDILVMKVAVFLPFSKMFAGG